MNEKYEAVIGLEVHTQLDTKTKIFCGCSTSFGQEPNTSICPICLGYPGVLPVMNRSVVELAVKTCHLLGFDVNIINKMDRKNYFYPDLPKGYQISQFDKPIGINGQIIIYDEGIKKEIKINRVHMEEDAGKLVHGSQVSQLDFNRAGVPLLEIVTDPVIHNSKEAYLYLKKLKQILEYGEISDCNMEEGSLRCDANVSVRLKGATELGTKTEVKNLNSFKFVQKAIDYEIKRHINLIEDGGKVRQETRLFDPDQGKTFLLRSKEEAHDYRYFPEPDLVPLDLNKKMVDQILAGLSESPDQKLERFQQEYNLPLYDSEVLTQEKSVANYFDSCALIFKNYKLISNWMMSELMGDWNDRGISADKSLVSPKQFCELLNLIETGKITGKIAKTVFVTMLDTGQNAQKIVEEKGLEVVSDTGELEKIIDEIIAKSPKVVQDYREGKQKAMGFFVGQVMKITRGKADPAVVNKILREKLS